MGRHQFDKSKDSFSAKQSASGATRSEGNGEEKKPFDKKRWRLQKYSQKYKVQNWHEQRKKIVLREYEKNKNRLNDTAKFDVAKIYEKESVPEENKEERVFKTNQERLLEAQEEKARQQEEFLKSRAEKEKARENAKKKRFERTRKLNKKTKKGQPLMKDRMQDLLERIQKSVANS